MKHLLAFALALVHLAAFALQPADVQITADPQTSVVVAPRKTNTGKVIGISINPQDTVSLNGKQLYPAPTPTNHHAGIAVSDPSTWPVGNPADAVDHFMFRQQWTDPNGPYVQAFVTPAPLPAPGDWEAKGDARTVVAMVRMAFDDMIVYPGQPGMAHHHTFYGNAKSDAFTKIADIRTGCLSTSRGGTMNCSEYWHPSVIDTLTGIPVRPKSMLVYYKDGNARYMGRPIPGGTQLFGDTIQPFPAGLVMIAGDATRSTPGGVGKFSCMVPSQGFIARAGMENLPTIPPCEVGDELWMSVGFPQCWDGVNLDSPDHKSHMAYPTNDNPGLPPGRSWDCPADHPVLLPQVTEIPMFPVTDAAAVLRWRLSSDVYVGPAGYSAHADWRNGWDPAIMNSLWQNCWVARRNCGTFDLGDGRGAAEFGSN